MKLQTEYFSSPIGRLGIVTDLTQCVHAICFENHLQSQRQQLVRRFGADLTLVSPSAPSRALQALQSYFDGELAALGGLSVDTGGTAFQGDVWRALRCIPIGSTLSYAALARQVGRARAVRAVGMANGANPICIVIPCHRVIGSDGSLTGFGGGLDRKRWLLRHEGARLWDGARALQAQLAL
jgi:methylated-DNA-[protein]-cysteine S-methyltransferase